MSTEEQDLLTIAREVYVKHIAGEPVATAIEGIATHWRGLMEDVGLDPADDRTYHASIVTLGALEKLNQETVMRTFAKMAGVSVEMLMMLVIASTLPHDEHDLPELDLETNCHYVDSLGEPCAAPFPFDGHPFCEEHR